MERLWAGGGLSPVSLEELSMGRTYFWALQAASALAQSISTRGSGYHSVASLVWVHSKDTGTSRLGMNQQREGWGAFNP